MKFVIDIKNELANEPQRRAELQTFLSDKTGESLRTPLRIFIIFQTRV